jgi:hypothetical protein
MDALRSPQFWAAGLAALAALLAAYMSIRSARVQHLRAHRQSEIDFRRQQLNELYGPIYMRHVARIGLWKFLPGENADGSRWLLVDHIQEVKTGGDAIATSAIFEILRLNDEIENLLVTKSGLYNRFPGPQSFSDFVAHCRLLKVCWEQGVNQTTDQRLPFPDSFVNDIAREISVIRERLAELDAPSSRPRHRDSTAQCPS